ncbi:tetrathionate reductase family octaheme c-type cytochrome [Roseibium aggregatum]|uniref:Tetrathionate reductase family octaheme c-type cytochrome n=1 Tax=Roseibium aggregatum TaxID=187304 RepID=A0A939EHG4_9HYPH|nr:tetrathionate reductase family octaheme c-type cytochrome [Roseibium aggregatum]MBN9673276.1 tetrathionate reductase family octaheme c-type cytochrome [Roseibium aggregatum]
MRFRWLKTVGIGGRTLPCILAAFVVIGGAAVHAQEKSPPTADHTKFESLKGPFTSGPEVTRACLACHTEAAKQVMSSIHWKWDYTHPVTGETLGKRNVINAFCGNVASNEPRCTSCHAGYGWEDESFDFSDETRVDCLVCHDTTGDYVKFDVKAGHPLYEPLTRKGGHVYPDSLKQKSGGMTTYLPPDLAKVSQAVGEPGRANCGACHFYGGGGDGVKHGDLDSSLVSPPVEVDVHMSPDGADLTCTDCHTAHGHQWPGSRYLGTVRDDNRGKPGFRRRDVASCQSCHTSTPHSTASIEGLKLNDHTDRVACQTCHIPEFARGGVATKTWWDWSTAGKLKDGKPYAEEDEHGHHSYLSKKGHFVWEENVVPDYAFWNGVVDYSLLGEKIDPSGVVPVNKIYGSAEDPGSRIYPFKRMRGKQAYDRDNNNLVLTNVFGPETDTAFWTNFDWDKSISAAMAKTDVPYSGNYDFVETEMWWPTTHMVAPAKSALSCGDCHARDGRLSGLSGFYLPGRDLFKTTDRIGLSILVLSLVGILGHSSVRIVMSRRRKRT